ncbi:hypothetical protein CPJCM30710_16370 [Clostridium polyendosporum]|uniref:Uncharacterized protein n=1 Tax=Clostridium polyendosporum TaxID=69208 RepID=A0A919RZ28_9CLOT|nr:YkuS family protein [Clostridium polyendosporum]GIM28971.1 hypothetical protein CPJCM30710_16370 [Clostridium polyendosporum]
MNIFISNDLKELREKLIERGYNIVSCNEVYDAIICNLKETDLSQLRMCNNYKSNGILIIDSGSKNVDDIENILINRSYSSLF